MKSLTSAGLVRFLIFGCVFAAVENAFASSLGPMTGAVVIGKPLDVQVSIKSDEIAPAGSSCLQVNIAFGDRSIPAERIVLTSQTGTTPNETRVRIRSLVGIDEPIVTVDIVHGCQQKNTKNYVLLADLLPPVLPPKASDIALPAIGVAPESTQPSQPATQPMSRSRQVGEGAAPDGSLVLQSRASNAGNSRPSSSVATLERPRKRVANNLSPALGAASLEKSIATQSRLVMQPLDYFSDAPLAGLVLRSSNELSSLPSTDPVARQTAIALWQSLIAQPEDVALASEKLKTLQSENSKALDRINQTTNRNNALANELEIARKNQYSNALVWSLLFLLLLVTIALVWMYIYNKRSHSQKNNADAWWNHGENPSLQAKTNSTHSSFNNDGGSIGQSSKNVSKPHLSNSFTDTFVFSIDPPDTKPAKDWRVLQNLPPKKDESEQGDINLDNLFGDIKAESQSLYFKNQPGRFENTIPLENKIKEFSLKNEFSKYPSMDEIFDVHQKADFLVSLGDFDSALAILKTHIAVYLSNTSALFYLDLFDLYHILGRQKDYKLLRIEFTRLFACEIPEYEKYEGESPGLENYSSPMRRIEMLWPRADVLHTIEKLVISKPDERDRCFSLQAYRDLLLLHTIAKKIIDETHNYLNNPEGFYSEKVSASSKSQFGNNESAPLAAGAPIGFISESNLKQSSPVILDIDLSIDSNNFQTTFSRNEKNSDITPKTKIENTNLIEFK